MSIYTLEVIITRDLNRRLSTARQLRDKAKKSNESVKIGLTQEMSYARMMYDYLSSHPERVVPYKELAEQVWADSTTKYGTIRMAAIQIRTAFGPDCLKTKIGVGYQWVEQDA